MAKFENLPRLLKAGLSHDDAVKLRQIGMRLHRWFEKECGDSDNYKSWAIVRDDETDKPYLEVHPHQGKSYREPIHDQETADRKRILKIMEKYPTLSVYIQTDPRGAPLRLIRPGDVPEGTDVECYYDRGLVIA